MKTIIKRPGNWSDYEDRELRKGVRQGQTAEEIAAHLSRMIQSVRTRSVVLKCPVE